MKNSTIQKPIERIEPIPPHEFAKLTVNEKMKRIRLISEFENTLVLSINGVGTFVKRSPYYQLKFVENYGGQIEWVFTSDGLNKVKETFNPGIYNCWLKGKVIQVEEPPVSAVRSVEGVDDTPGIARSILNEDYEMFRSVVNEWRSVIAQQDTIEMLLAQFTRESADGKEARLRIGNKRYVIDNRFMVDDRGQAHYHTGSDWKFLCLVAPSAMKTRTIRTHKHDDVTLNSVTNLILAKVMFCLFPTRDTVFIEQLPGGLKKDINDELDGRKPRLG